MISQPNNTSINALLQLNKLQFLEGTNAYRLSGSFNTTENVGEAQTSAFTVGVGGVKMYISSPDYSDAVTIDYGNITTAFDASDSLVSTHIAAEITSSLTQMRVSIVSSQPITQRIDSFIPQSGQIQIAGNQSGLLATIVSSNDIQLKLDANDDGIYDSTTSFPPLSLLQ